MAYSTITHKRAFNHYKKLRSANAVTKQSGMPALRTIEKWKADYNCNCGYHKWDELIETIAAKVREKRLNKEAEKTHTQKEAELNQIAEEDVKTLELLALLEKRIKGSAPGWTIKDSSIKEAASALEKIVKTRRLIKGDSTENINNQNASDVYDKAVAKMDEKFNKLLGGVSEEDNINTDADSNGDGT